MAHPVITTRSEYFADTTTGFPAGSVVASWARPPLSTRRALKSP